MRRRVGKTRIRAPIPKRSLPNRNAEDKETVVPITGKKSGTRSNSRGRPTCFYYGQQGHFQKNCRHFRKDKETDDTDSKRSLDRRGPDRKGTTAIATSEEELLLITEESELNLAGDEMTWVVDSGASSTLPRIGNASHPTQSVIMVVSGWGMKVHAELSA